MARYNKTKKKGRSSNVPNLKRIDGVLVNMHGVNFTDEDKRLFINATERANYRRKQMLKAEAKLPRVVNGKPTGDTVASLQMMGKESDFILAKRSKSLQQFETREQFDKALAKLERITDKNNFNAYIDHRVSIYKENYIKALKNALGDNETKDIQLRISTMSTRQYMKTVQSNENLEIWYVYSEAEAITRREMIRKELGLDNKEEFINDM